MSGDQMTHALSNSEQRPGQETEHKNWRDYYREKWLKKANNCPCRPDTYQQINMHLDPDFCLAMLRPCEQERCPHEYWMKD